MNNAIREQLEALAEEKYRIFSSSLLPGCDNILGVRLPLLRKLAKTIAKGDFRGYLASSPADYFEEIMLKGMVIGYAKADAVEKLDLVAAHVPHITNWSLCDSFSTGLVFTRDHKEAVFGFLVPYLRSGREYSIRFAVVMLLTYYIDDEYIDRVIRCLDDVRHDAYYVKMAVAWAVSVCFVKYPDKTKAYLESCSLDDFTFNKSLQKIIESFRVDKETKDLIRNMRR